MTINIHVFFLLYKYELIFAFWVSFSIFHVLVVPEAKVCVCFLFCSFEDRIVIDSSETFLYWSVLFRKSHGLKQNKKNRKEGQMAIQSHLKELQNKKPGYVEITGIFCLNFDVGFFF